VVAILLNLVPLLNSFSIRINSTNPNKMIYKFVLILIFVNIGFQSLCQKGGQTYYSYPDRKIKIIHNDTSIFWVECYMSVGYDKGDFYKYISKNDTLYITTHGDYAPP
jgi:hypothetical protein